MVDTNSGQDNQIVDYQKLQKRLIFMFIVVVCFFVAIAVSLLPYRLYTRDVHEARKKAREVAELIQEGLLSTMIATGDRDNIRGVIQTFKKRYEFQFRMIRSKHVEKQHGVKEDEQATDDLIRQVLTTGKSRDDWINRTTFRYVSPFISDSRCQECHESVTGATIGVGEVLGASEIIFDLAEMEIQSVKLIMEILSIIITSFATMGTIFFLIIKKGVLEAGTMIKKKDY